MCKYVVVDLEMCRVPREKRMREFRWSSETIQIGAVVLDEEYNIVDEFNTYVKPEYGCLDFYITNLTGIKSKDIDHAPVMKEALTMFLNWIPEGAVVVSWSDNDLRQIKREATVKGINDERLEPLKKTWIDSQKMFSDRIKNSRHYGLSEALLLTDIIQEGQEHNGLVDAYNTARLFAKMMTEENLTFNKWYEQAKSNNENSFCIAIGDLIGEIKVV